MLFTASAYASGTIAKSVWTIHSRLGVNSQAMVQSDTAVNGFTTVEPSGGGNLPVGYMGAMARIYNSNGAVIKQSSWLYNSKSTNLFTVGTSDTPVSGAYHSRGAIRVFDGGKYLPDEDTARTPNVNY